MIRACWSRASLAVPLLALSLVSMLEPRPAQAQVSWQPAERCAEAREELPPVTDVADPPAVEVAVTGTEGHWLATLRVRYANGSSGARRISARSCSELGRAVAVALSLLDSAQPLPEPARTKAVPAPAATPSPPPERAASAASLTPAPVSSSPVVVAAPAAATAPLLAPALAAPEPRVTASGGEDVPRAASAHAAPPSFSGFIRASSLLAVAGQRFGEIGAVLAGGAWLGAWGAQLELSARRPLAKLTVAHDFTLQLERYALGLQPCARLLGRVELAFCGGPRLELLQGLALGPSEPKSDLVWLPGVSAGSRLRLPLTVSWALSGELQVSWSMRRAQASVAPWGRVYELPRPGTGLLLGAEWML